VDNEVGIAATQKLSRIVFYLALNTHLSGTFICDRLNRLELKVDDEGNLPPKIIGAICVMLRAAPGTEISCARQIPAFRKMLDFLDPYLEPPYRPESDEIKPLIYLPYN
jgi:hypothetical protein